MKTDYSSVFTKLKNKKKHKLLTELINGKIQTVGQWAIDLYGSDILENKSRVSSMASWFRKRGVMIFVIKTRGEGEKGDMMLVNDDPIRFKASYFRHSDWHVTPLLMNNAKYAGLLTSNHPKTRQDVINRAQEIIRVAIEAQNDELGITYR